MNQLLEQLLIARGKAKLRTAEKPLRRIHDAYDHTLTVHHRHNGDAHMDRTPTADIANLPILRPVAFCGINARHHLQTRDDNRREFPWKLNGPLPKKPIHTHTNPHEAAHRFEMNIGRIFGKCRVQNCIDQCEYRTAV